MKKIILIVGFVLLSTIANAKTSVTDIKKEASWFCGNNNECIDVISLELQSMYFQGLNERDPVTIGTLINRKHKEFINYCEYSPNPKICVEYKAKLMLQYITGLLDR